MQQSGSVPFCANSGKEKTLGTARRSLAGRQTGYETTVVRAAKTWDSPHSGTVPFLLDYPLRSTYSPLRKRGVRGDFKCSNS